MSCVSDVGSLRCVGRRYNFLKYERVILNFYHPSIQSSRLQSCVSVKTRIQLYVCCVSSNPRIQGWWWWGRRETVEYNGPLITRIAQSKLQHFSKLLLFFPFSRQGHFLLTQPSSPNSFVNRSCTSKSAAATVGLALKSIFLKSPNVMGGGITRSAYPKLASSSSVEAQAEGSPGEQGT